MKIKSTAALNGSFFEDTTILIVEDDEAGVDRITSPAMVDVHRGGMTPVIVGGFVQRQFVVAMQMVGDRHAGDAGADDGDAAHRAPRLRISGSVRCGAGNDRARTPGWV